MAFSLRLFLLEILVFLPFCCCSSEQDPIVYSLGTDTIVEEVVTYTMYAGESKYFLADSTNKTLSCDPDLQGIGSLDSICTLNASVSLVSDSSIIGNGSLKILSNVSLSCAIPGCTIRINISGDLYLEESACIIAGTLIIYAARVEVSYNGSLDSTGLGGAPPAQTSGTPLGLDGAGGGHGGRGACCVTGDKEQEDTWGGDVYSWSSLSTPWSYGSKGGTRKSGKDLGGGGGGRILVNAKELLSMNGTISADGGYGGEDGGGGSGGSIQIQTSSLAGTGEISASGGTGWAGGGGGRIAIDSIEKQGLIISAHGGDSLGCQNNAGAAGTKFDVYWKSLTVSNSNRTTETDTLLMEFPTYPLWENVYLESHAKVTIPLLWSRVQVRGWISLKHQASLGFGLASYPFSEFELAADEVEMADSTIKVYGALKLSVKMFLMQSSVLRIDGGGDIMVATTIIDASNFVLLADESTIVSNANLGVHGQGYFKLNGTGDTIKAQRLFLSLFYNIDIAEGALLQAPLDEGSTNNMTPSLYCDSPTCPGDIIQPPEDCNLNTSLPFTLQICRVEDVILNGLVKGSIVHIHRAHTLTIQSAGLITASGLGCKAGIGQGGMSETGAGGGAGHGGKGGDGFFNSSWAKGGKEYGSKTIPCELGSGSGNSTSKQMRGGGVIVIGSLEHPISIFEIHGALTADGEGYKERNHAEIRVGGVGGGSGGSLLFFLQTLNLVNGSHLSTFGGDGSPVGGGGGGGGRVHFHWSNIPTGDDYISPATVMGSIWTRGGAGSDGGYAGKSGTLTGRDCPSGLYGIFCEECPVGTYKNEMGSDPNLCKLCSPERLPHRAKFTYVRGGATAAACPYKCISDKYRMPHCYTPLEELIYTLGGPWFFAFLLCGVLIVLALVLSIARMKLVGTDEFSGPAPTPQGAHIDHSHPFLESLNEVLETTRVEESQNHVHRLYFMGSNSFSEPWHLPHSPPEQITELIYEDAFNRFVDEINSIAAYQWWEGSVHGILSVLAYPIAWSWQQWRCRKKVQRLREYVRSEYDHACLRSCRSRALYEGLKVAATPDLMLAYIDFFLGGDEKRPDLPPRLLQRLPLSIIFGGDGSYMAPYSLHSDNLLTSLLGQAVPATMWYRMVAGLNAQLRTVRRGSFCRSLLSVVNWLNSHANPKLYVQGIHVDLAWFQATASGYFQLGIVVTSASEDAHVTTMFPDFPHGIRTNNGHMDLVSSFQLLLSPENEIPSHNVSRRRIGGGIIDAVTLRSLEDRKDILFPLSFILYNVRPVGHQDLVGLIISILLLGDFSLMLLTLLQFYSISLGAFLVVLFVLPLASLLPFPAGINALFSHGPRKSAGLARVYALWNMTSLANVVAALFYGFIHYKIQHSNGGFILNRSLNFSTEESGWWLFPTALLFCKCIQARMVDWHIANLEIQDRTVYAKDPAEFWDS